MKGKLKFDTSAIKSFFLSHGEKLGFALVAVCLLLFVAGAVGVTGYDKTPQQIMDLVAGAKAKLDPPDGPPPDPEAIKEDNGLTVSEEVARLREEIKDATKLHTTFGTTIWTPYLFEPKPKRGEPKLYPITDLLASVHNGAIQVQPNEVNPLLSRSVVGRRWVTITGLIPLKKQVEAYDEVFENAQLQLDNKDFPQYIYYNIEREELDTPNPTGEPNWSRVPLNLQLNVTPARDDRLPVPDQLWSGTGSEVVSTKFIIQDGRTPIAFPLPQLAYETFGEDEAHPPEIPIASVTQLQEEQEALLERMREREEGVAGIGGDVAREFEIAIIEEELLEEEIEEHGLFRFLDFNVEPGKFYRYRFRLQLYNPNFDLDLMYLQRVNLRDDPYLLTEWSEPSEVIGVPPDARPLLASVKPAPAGRVTMEPKAKVGIEFFFMETGDKLFEEYEVIRGKYLNYPEIELPEHITPLAYALKLAAIQQGAVGAADADPEDIEPPTVDFISDTTVLDMRGGARLPGRDLELTEPGELLLLSPAGTLVVRNELDDLDEFPVEEETAAAGVRRPGAGRDDDGGLFDEEDAGMYDDDDDDE